MPTLNQTIAWAQSMLGTYIPLTAQTGNEPALTIANGIVSLILNAPFPWATNRAENASVSTVAGTQDYVINAADFGWLEAVTLGDANGNFYGVPRVYNSVALTRTSKQDARPQAAGVKLITTGTSFALRFLSCPDAIYTVTATYQKIPTFFTATTQDWFTQANIPQNQMFIYNNLFLAEAFQVNGDPQSAAMYRRRGMASLLATAEGLTELQKSMIFAQATFSDIQTIAANLRAQTAAEARTI